MGLLIIPQLPIAVLGRHQRNGIKGSRIKGNHGENQHHQHQPSQRKCLQNLHDGHIKISRRVIEGQNIQLSQHLQTHGIVAKDNKAHQRATETENITAQYSLSNGPAPGNCTDEEGRGHTPYHPVSPVKYRPALHKAGLPLRVRIGRHGEEILHKTPQGGKTGLQNIPAFAAEEQHIQE